MSKDKFILLERGDDKKIMVLVVSLSLSHTHTDTHTHTLEKLIQKQNFNCRLFKQ
jgi:hypothetical protein